jgi:hypothetical protein
MLEAPPLPADRVRLTRRPSARQAIDTHVRTVRPSLLDLRFCGDPWIEARRDGAVRLCLGDYALTGLSAAPLDLQALNSLFHGMRHRRPRRNR